MKTIPQLERTYTKLVEAGALVNGPPEYRVEFKVGDQKFHLEGSLDKATAEWFRRKFAAALYKVAALEK